MSCLFAFVLFAIIYSQSCRISSYSMWKSQSKGYSFFFFPQNVSPKNMAFSENMRNLYSFLCLSLILNFCPFIVCTPHREATVWTSRVLSGCCSSVIVELNVGRGHSATLSNVSSAAWWVFSSWDVCCFWRWLLVDSGK